MLWRERNVSVRKSGFREKIPGLHKGKLARRSTETLRDGGLHEIAGRHRFFGGGI